MSSNTAVAPVVDANSNGHGAGAGRATSTVRNRTSSGSDIAITVRDLAKSYTIVHEERKSGLIDTMIHRVKNPMKRPTRETFWALNGASFEVKRGDVIGIIGRNGAGKSTLLKVLSRITEPTRGEAIMHGRVGSLLEVGTGFHPELTGRENVYLNGAVLGMSRTEIDRQFDAIVDFSGTEKFLDTPVKRYSSGMYVRLAFAVAAHLNPEILIVDEVLAVGDTEFQKKCIGKMRDVAGQGRTVLFVSHSMSAVSALCNRAIHMRHGQVEYDGSTEEAIHHYLGCVTGSTDGTAVAGIPESERLGNGAYRFQSVTPTRGFFNSGEEVSLDFRVAKRKEGVGTMYFSAHLIDESGLEIVQMDSRLCDCWSGDADLISGTLRMRTPWLKPGNYRVDAYVCGANLGILDKYENAAVVRVAPVLPYGVAASPDSTAAGIIFADFQWTASPVSI